MKLLDAYIKEMLDSHKHVEYDCLDQQVYEHCMMHYKFNYLLPSEYTIYESTGAFPGQHEMVQRIKNECERSGFKSTVIKFDNDIVDDLYVHFRNDNDPDIHGSYQLSKGGENNCNEVRWDEYKKQFRLAEITVFNHEKNSEGFEEILYHETKHLWDDYQEALRKGKFLLDQKLNSLEYKYRNHPQKFIRQLLYFAERYEVSAYVAQMNGVLGNRKFDNIQSAFDEIVKRCPIYDDYKQYYYALSNEKVLNVLRKYLSEKELNKVRTSIKNAWRKMVNHTYHVCGEHLNECRLSPSNRKHFKNIESEILS